MVFPQGAHILEEGQTCPNNQGTKAGAGECLGGPGDRGLFATEEVAFEVGEGGNQFPRVL